MKFMVLMPKMDKERIKKTLSQANSISRESHITFEQSFVNFNEGFGMFIFNARSRNELQELLFRLEVPSERVLQVEERMDRTLIPDYP